MDKDNKNRSGSQSNRGSSEGRGHIHQKEQPGGPDKNNRQTNRNENDGQVKTSDTKKGSNNI